MGTQLLTTEETIFSDIEKIKFIVKETYGGNKTCINNIYLYEYLPSVDITMSYQNFELNTEQGNNTKNKTLLKNHSKTLNIGELSMNEITQEINDNNVNDNNNKMKEKIFSNNLPTRTTEILISESDLTDKKPINKKNNFLLLDIMNNNRNDNKKINNNVNNFNRNKNANNIIQEEEKQNAAHTSFNEDLLQKNIAVHSKPKEHFNNSNIIFTTNEFKNYTTDNNINDNMLNTISNLSNINNNDKYNSFKMSVKNKFNEYDLRISNIENDINNLKELVNEILNNINQIMIQNKNKDEKEYNYILTECKTYIDNKMTNICETLENNQRNYYDTQPYIYNQSYSINSNVIHPNLYNGSDIFYNNDKNISTEKNIYRNHNTNANINTNNSNNFRNKMNISKIFKNKFKKPELTQQISNNLNNHKKALNSLKREKSLDVLNIKKNLLLNKNILKNNFSKKNKKENKKEKE